MRHIISDSDTIASVKGGGRVLDDYFRAMSEFRHQIRRFQRFSEDVAAEVGVEPQQHLLMLAVRGLPPGQKPSIRVIADRLLLKHHSVVELVDRSERMGLIRRVAARDDRRQVLLELTAKGERILRQIFVQNRDKLKSQSAELSEALQRLTREQRNGKPRRRQP